MKRVINIPSKLEHISLIEKTIDEITENLILSPDVYGKVLIASIEGVNNAIVHGNKQDENKSVIVELFADKSKITITIKDQGPGFDPNCIPDPTKPENLENISGRGVFLMKKLSDKIEFENNGSTVIMHFNIV
ncbi:MAG: serine/threonine-protein kinase RsbW [Thermoanaerobacterium sp.]|jgi:serine/threonine-protein kinase RsbW|nr:serine/threonine-protein kinase RsbW [Thermoanaerobacterium sp.]